MPRGRLKPPLTRSNAVATLDITSAKAIDAGFGYSLALLSNGTVYAWGDNLHYCLGLGEVSTYQTNRPTQIPGLSGITKIAAGTQHALALKDNGTVWAWGEGDNGKLGNNSTAAQSSPVQVSNLTNVMAIAAAYQHSLAVTSNGTVYGWGEGAEGKLGDGQSGNRLVPSLVSDVNYSGVALGLIMNCTNIYGMQTNIIDVAAGRNFSLALTANGEVLSWGSHQVGQLGIGGASTGTTNTPQQVKDEAGTGVLIQIVAIAASKHEISGQTPGTHALAQRFDGKLLAWGDNEFGQLGVNTNSFSERTLPIAVSFP